MVSLEVHNIMHQNLSYNAFIPYINVIFKRKSLRAVSTEVSTAKLDQHSPRRLQQTNP